MDLCFTRNARAGYGFNVAAILGILFLTTVWAVTSTVTVMLLSKKTPHVYFYLFYVL